VRLLIGFVLMALLSAVGIAAGSSIVGYLNGQKQARNRLDSVALSKELQINTWADGVQNKLAAILIEEHDAERAAIVLTLARDHQYYAYYASGMREQLRLFAAQAPKIWELFLLDLDGQVILSTNEEREGMVDSNQLYFQHGLSETFLQLPFQTKEMTAFVARPVLGENEQSLGVLVGRVETSLFRQILADQAGLGDTGKAYLVDQTHTLLTASNLGLEKLDNLSEELGNIDLILEKKLNNSDTYTDYRGIQVIGASRWLPKSQATLVVEQDQSEVFQSIFTSLGINLGITLFIVSLAVMISSYISKSIATPLVDLADTATQIAAGDITRRAEVHSEDEVGVVARSFNSMTAQLHDLINSLEERVKERTQTLQRQALQLKTSTQVGQEITSILEIDALLIKVAQLIQEAFGYYHVHVFLVDRDDHNSSHESLLRLRASSAEIWPQFQSLKIGKGSLNGEAALTKQPLLVNDVSQEERFLVDEQLLDSRSELVIPLFIGDKVIGTLDVHSATINAFTQEDVLVIQSLGNQIAIAIENARLYKRSSALAVLEERNRLARELHDSVTQSLYGMVVFAGAGREVMGTGKVELAREHLARVEQAAQQALKEMRLLVYELRPPMLEQVGLVGALQQRLDAVEGRTGIETHLLAEEASELPASEEAALFGIAQEALNNILKHAAATIVTVQIRADDEGLALTVTDDGEGFDPESDTGGLGLTNMRERAQQLGASLTIHSSPGEGTQISVRKTK